MYVASHLNRRHRETHEGSQLLKFVDQYGDGDIVTPEVFAEYRFKIYNDRLNDNPVVRSNPFLFAAQRARS